MQEIDRVRKEATEIVKSRLSSLRTLIESGYYHWEQMDGLIDEHAKHIVKALEEEVKVSGTTLKELLEKLDETGGDLAIVGKTEVKLGTSYGRSTDYCEEWWIEIDGEHIDPYKFIELLKRPELLREVIWQGGQK